MGQCTNNYYMNLDGLICRRVINMHELGVMGLWLREQLEMRLNLNEYGLMHA